MRRFRLALLSCCLGFLLMAIAPAVHAGAPALAQGQRIYSADAPLSVGLHSTPTVSDWNNDGKVDLLVGEFTNGYINLLLNVSTGAIPRFNGSARVLANGVPITMSYG